MSAALRFVTACAIVLAVRRPSAQSPVAGRRRASSTRRPAAGGPADSSATAIPSGYVIGADDVLSIVFWRDKDMSAEVTVRPDGKVTLPLLNDVHAAGLTPEQLRDTVLEAARKFVEDPNPTVIVKEINSRKSVHHRPGREVGALSAEQHHDRAAAHRDGRRAQGVRARQEHLGVAQRERAADGVQLQLPDVLNRKNLEQNIELRPGDTVVVP